MSMVIKYGGNAMTDGSVRSAVAAAIRRAAADGLDPIVVHGGGPFIEAELKRAGIESAFVRGLRVTSDDAMTAVETALTLLGKKLAQEIGGAVSLTGRDDRLLGARVLHPELGRVGEMTRLNRELIDKLLSVSITPVVACLAVDETGRSLNVNGDQVAGFVAGALRCPAVFLTNVPGVLSDPTDPASLVPELSRARAQEWIDDGRIAGGMIPKVESALAAVDAGAQWALIASGMRAEGLRAAISGAAGTRIVPG